MATGISRGGYLYIGASITLTVLATLAFAVRIYFRILRQARPGMDDYFIFVGLFFDILMAFEAVMWSVIGKIGHPTATLSQNQMELFFLWFWVNELTYSVICPMIKMGLLFFYRRLFPLGQNRKLKIAIIAVMALVIMWGIAVFTVSVLQCLPVTSFWKDHNNAQCINPTKFFLANSVSNFLLDVLILVLPARTVCKLQMERRSKWGLLVVLSLGSFTCITAIIRISSLSKIHDDDIVLTVVTPAVWTTVEPGVAIICACLPSLRIAVDALNPHLCPYIATMSSILAPLRPAFDLIYRPLRMIGLLILRIGVTIFNFCRPCTKRQIADEEATIELVHPLAARDTDGHLSQDAIELVPIERARINVSTLTVAGVDGSHNGSKNDVSNFSSHYMIHRQPSRMQLSEGYAATQASASRSTAHRDASNNV